jgi:two-component system chemotaxis response regulator CheB
MTIRILVVDDSVVIRKLLTATLADVPGMEVVATAALGKIALAKIPQVNPDIVILDVEMPEMNGIETLRLIRKDSPRLPVIMFSTKTERGAAATIEALTCGASDYVTKPSNAGNVLVAMARVRDEMVPKIHALTGGARAAAARVATGPASTSPASKTITLPVATTIGTSTHAMAALSSSPTVPMATLPSPAIAPARQTVPLAVHSKAATTPIRLDPAPRPIRQTGPRPPVEIIAIGASTGGPNALSMMLAQLPAEFPVPIVIVQHMLATFTRHFAERLASQCQIRIVEATAGDVLQPGHAYIARGDYHLVVERRTGRPNLQLNQDQFENFCRPAVDVLFRSVAQVYGASALAVILTGMGHDGMLGCGAIRDAGGEVLVQDEPSSVVWGMPGFVARAGLANQVMPLDRLGGELRRRVALGGPRVGATQ